jgi:hypothetical protein
MWLRAGLAATIDLKVNLAAASLVRAMQLMHDVCLASAARRDTYIATLEANCAVGAIRVNLVALKLLSSGAGQTLA